MSEHAHRTSDAGDDHDSRHSPAPGRLPRRSATRELRERLGISLLPGGSARRLRPVAPGLVGAITDEILSEVAAYARSSASGRRSVVSGAVAAAVGLFLDLLDGEPTDPAAVSARFCRVGREEAFAGRSLDGVRAALDLAMHRAADALGASPARELLDGHHPLVRSALLDYMAMLMEDIARGHAVGVQERESDVRWLRRSLARALITGTTGSEIASLAARAAWPLPETVAVCSADLAAPITPESLPDDALSVQQRARMILIVPGGRARATAAVMEGWPRRGPVVVTAAVPIRDVAAAVEWADRALRLVALGVIPAQPVVWCADHHPALLMHADPTLSRWEAAEVLAPLDAEKGGYRRSLARTLRVWLLTGEDAKQLAARLGLHEHTVRNHKQRLVELYGTRLKDPEFTTLLLFALSLELAEPAQG